MLWCLTKSPQNHLHSLYVVPPHLVPSGENVMLQAQSVCHSTTLDSKCCKQSLMLQDPVDKKPAVLVQRYNITQQKQLELQLHLQQEALQR